MKSSPTLHPVVQNDLEYISRHATHDLAALEGKNMLITGASGMLARYLVQTFVYANRHLLSKPAHLFLVTRHQPKTTNEHPWLHTLVQDVSQPIPVKNMHYIVHAASQAAPKIYAQRKMDTINANILGLYHALHTVGKNPQGIVFFSSAEVYGNQTGHAPLDEKMTGCIDHLSPRSCYVEAKRMAETMCMNAFLEKHLPINIARIFHTFGPGMNLKDGRVFSDFFANGLRGENIEISGNVNLKRSFLYISDATIMFIKLLTGKKFGEVFNIANPKNTASVGEFAQLVCNAWNAHRKDRRLRVIIEKKDQTHFQGAALNTIPTIAKFTKAFAFTPSVTLPKACDNTVRTLC